MSLATVEVDIYVEQSGASRVGGQTVVKTLDQAGLDARVNLYDRQSLERLESARGQSASSPGVQTRTLELISFDIDSAPVLDKAKRYWVRLPGDDTPKNRVLFIRDSYEFTLQLDTERVE